MCKTVLQVRSVCPFVNWRQLTAGLHIWCGRNRELMQTIVLPQMEASQSMKRRRLDCSGGSVDIENVERNDGGADCKHKVFLSHSGEQKDFVEQMCDEIERHERSAYFDKNRDCLPLGCDFPEEIFKAIEECEVGVVVLSKAFFTKTVWPMEEFARLAKRKERNKEFVIILVLYKDIELAECCNVEIQMEWKQLWEEWALSHKRISIDDWTSVFKLFGPILAISYDKVGGAKRLIKEVVAEVCKLVMPETRGDDPDMQGRERICELVCEKMHASQVSREDGACLVGLYGVGGIGKSTVCKALSEKLRPEFCGRVCYVELSNNNDDEKENELLGEMVKRLIGTPHEVVAGYNKTERLNLLMAKLRNHRVFLAIDNVGDGASTKRQAKAFLKARFAKDSFVVVTARTIEMLQDVGMKGRECHEMPELNYEEAKSLFLENAPEGVHLEDAFIEDCVRRCYFSKGEGERHHYHPLALKVLGGQLGSDAKEWRLRLKGRDPFNALREREGQIFGILRSSFDSLEPGDQMLFMDVALFFPERNNRVNDFFEGINIMTWLCMIHGEGIEALMSRLKALKQKSLIECVGDGIDVVGMHDLWREFCVTETRKDDLRRGQRWFYREDEIHDSDEERRLYNGGWEDLRRVCITAHSFWSYLKVRRVNLQHCSNLTVLKLVTLDVESRVLDVSSLLQLKSLEVGSETEYREDAGFDIQGLGLLRDLCVLVWFHIPSYSASIGEIASLINLEVLVLNEAFWHSACRPGSIRFSDLRDLPRLWLVRLRMNVLPVHLVWTGMANLQHLDLSRGKGMRSCNGLEDMVALVTLNLSQCSDLETLPCLGKLTKLVTLNLSECFELETLPYLGRLTKLETLDISWSGVSEVPGLDRLEALQKFKAEDCKRLKRLPNMQLLLNLEVCFVHSPIVEPVSGLEGLTALRRLLVSFDALKDCPSQPQLTKLQEVTINSWGEQGLPCMVGWTSVKTLKIIGACGVCELEGLENLSSLQTLEINSCDFRDVSIVSCLTSLQKLIIWDCKKLEKVPSLEQLLKLECLMLVELGSAMWEVCGTLPQLRELIVWDVALHCLPNLSNFPQLRSLSISKCDALTCVTSEGPLAMLEKVEISNCSRFESPPSFNPGCPKLWNVNVRHCLDWKFDVKDPKPHFWTFDGKSLRMEYGEYNWDEK